MKTNNKTNFLVKKAPNIGRVRKARIEKDIHENRIGINMNQRI